MSVNKRLSCCKSIYTWIYLPCQIVYQSGIAGAWPKTWPKLSYIFENFCCISNTRILKLLRDGLLFAKINIACVECVFVFRLWFANKSNTTTIFFRVSLSIEQLWMGGRRDRAKAKQRSVDKTIGGWGVGDWTCRKVTELERTFTAEFQLSYNNYAEQTGPRSLQARRGTMQFS